MLETSLVSAAVLRHFGEMIYQGDSFFTLGPWAQIGLLALSAVLSLGVLAGAGRAMRGRGRVWRLSIAVLAFALFVWLSPQIYYTYYRMIIEGLPQQWVIGWPPFQDMLAKATFTGPSNLSAHGQGALLWLLVGLSLRASKPRDPHP